MAPDKFTAVWLSHSSISDFIKCPRLYYLRAIYRDKRNGHKISLMQPPLALGQAVHEVVESLSILPVEERLRIPLSKKLEVSWEKISGKKGGFKNREEEMEYKERAYSMIKRIEENPGPLLKKAVKIKADGGLPYYFISEEEKIILCGKIDWIEYLSEDDSIHIIDFKTGKHDEDEDSLQLPIYYLLAKNLQKRNINKLSYWYLDREKEPISMAIPDAEVSFQKIMEIARRVKLARQIQRFKCEKDGCFACRSLERVANGEGEKVNVSEYGQDIYVLND